MGCLPPMPLVCARPIRQTAVMSFPVSDGDRAVWEKRHERCRLAGFMVSVVGTRELVRIRKGDAMKTTKLESTEFMPDDRIASPCACSCQFASYKYKRRSFLFEPKLLWVIQHTCRHPTKPFSTGPCPCRSTTGTAETGRTSNQTTSVICLSYYVVSSKLV